MAKCSITVKTNRKKKGKEKAEVNGRRRRSS